MRADWEEHPEWDGLEFLLKETLQPAPPKVPLPRAKVLWYLEVVWGVVFQGVKLTSPSS